MMFVLSWLKQIRVTFTTYSWTPFTSKVAAMFLNATWIMSKAKMQKKYSTKSI